MIYFTQKELIISIIAFTGLGAFFSVAKLFLLLVYNILREPFKAIKKSFIRYKTKQKTQDITRQSGISCSYQILDVFAVLFIGIIYILFLYLFLDGLFRIFTFISFILGFFLIKKTIVKSFSLVNNIFMNYYIGAIDYIIYIATFPVFLIIELLKRLFNPLIIKFITIIHMAILKILIQKKCRQIKKIFN